MDKNIFDDMTVLPATDTVIDEASVAENTKADVDAVLSRVYSSIGKKKKRRPVRRLIAAAAAAVILICIFSLPVVAENLYVLYGSIVGGDCYTGDFTNVKDAEVKFYDPDLKLESLQVSSYEGTSDFIDIRLSKKSGGAFTDNTFNIIQRGDFSAWFSNKSDPAAGTKHDLEMIVGASGDDKLVTDGMGYDALYGTENEGKTLRILIRVNVTAHDSSGKDVYGKSLTGKKIIVRSNSYVASGIDSVIAGYEEINDGIISELHTLEENNRSVIPYDIFTNSYYYTGVIYNNDRFELVKARSKTFSLPFEVSFTMDCDISGKAYDIGDDTLTGIFGQKAENGRLYICPAGIALYAGTQGVSDLPDMTNWFVSTKDGKKYYICADGCSYSGDFVFMNCNFKLFPNNSLSNNFDKKLYSVDPENISRVVINGITVYGE